MDSKSPPAAPTASTLDVKPHQRVRTKSRPRPKHKPGNNNPNPNPNPKAAGGSANLEESSNSLEAPSLEVTQATDDNPEGEDVKSTDDGPPTNMICFVDPDEQPGLLVTDELDAAIEECKAKVERISKDCRARNRKFRFVFPISPHHLTI